MNVESKSEKKMERKRKKKKEEEEGNTEAGNGENRKLGTKDGKERA